MRTQLFLFIGLVVCIIGGTYILWTKTQDQVPHRIPTDAKDSHQTTPVPTPNDVTPSLSSVETPPTEESGASDDTDTHTDLSMQHTPSMQSHTQTNVSPSFETTGTFHTMAWLYPGEPGCHAQREYRDGRKIDVLKPEFFTITGGSLTRIDAESTACNGYSLAFVADLKKYAREIFVTVSSPETADMDTFFETALTHNDDIDTLVQFVVAHNLTGIELDFEDFGGWSVASYVNYKKFVSLLGDALHKEGKKLMLDAPMITDNTEQAWYQWRYEDFSNLPVDYIVLMAYDYQFDHGVGEPIAPLEWMRKGISWASARFPAQTLSVGIPSYGYEGTEHKKPIIRTYEQLRNRPGFTTAERHTGSGERTWISGNTVYFYQDATSIQQKIAVVIDAGINSISLWHLGGNPWF